MSLMRVNHARIFIDKPTAKPTSLVVEKKFLKIMEQRKRKSNHFFISLFIIFRTHITMENIYRLNLNLEIHLIDSKTFLFAYLSVFIIAIDSTDTWPQQLLNHIHNEWMWFMNYLLNLCHVDRYKSKINFSWDT